MMNNIILFGCGKTGKEALEYYGEEKVYGFCDNNYNQKEFMGKPIIPRNDLKNIVGSNSNYRIIIAVKKGSYIKEITRQLYEEGIHFELFEYNKLIEGSNEDIFSSIYHNNYWGENDENPYYSGPGSHQADIIEPYICLLKQLIENNDINKIIEIGCGDFNIMNRVLADEEKVTYIGLDVVQDLVDYNNLKFSNDKISFQCVDASESNSIIPDGDMLVIRQVLQHLNNSCIARILKKSKKYKYVLITEHISSDSDAIYNLDIPSGHRIRVDINSGVYIEQPPYNIKSIVHLLLIEVPKYGVIRTSLIINE